MPLNLKKPGLPKNRMIIKLNHPFTDPDAAAAMIRTAKQQLLDLLLFRR